LRVGIVTLFPEIFASFLSAGMVGRAVASGALAPTIVSLREFGLGKHRSVDDTPYGGGSGMVMRVDCIVDALEAFDAGLGAAMSTTGATSTEGVTAASGEGIAEAAAPARAHRVLLTPQGAPLTQAKAIELAGRPSVALVCGRYEGFDERVRGFIDEEISLGDFVMTGGEVAAMAIIDTCSRLLPGVLGNPGSAMQESHSPAMEGMLEYPQYTRPATYRGAPVPDVLQGGNHAVIAAWRRAQAEQRTAERRPDIWARIRARRGGGEGRGA
jgi:tRNA (guanine37-N1)-methyltransferase